MVTRGGGGRFKSTTGKSGNEITFYINLVEQITPGLKKGIRELRKFQTEVNKIIKGNATVTSKFANSASIGGALGLPGASSGEGTKAASASSKAVAAARNYYGVVQDGINKVGRAYRGLTQTTTKNPLIPTPETAPAATDAVNKLYGNVDKGLKKVKTSATTLGNTLQSTGLGQFFGLGPPRGPGGGFTPTGGDGQGGRSFQAIDGALTRSRIAFQGFNKSLQALNKSLFPLINRYTLLFTVGYGLPNLIDRILDSTQSQVDAEAKLLAALGGRVQAFERIAKLSKDLQTTTRFADEELLEAAALLKNMGVAADDLDDALKAAVETSAAIGVELTAAANSIGLFQQNATGATFGLTRRIPELKKLAAEGRLASEGVQLLLDRFGGLAEQIAQTPFGRAEIAYNQLRDVLTTIGAELTKIRAAFLEEFAERLQFIEEFASGKGFKRFIEGFEEFVPVTSDLALILAKIVGSLITIGIGKWLYPVLASSVPVLLFMTKWYLILRGIFAVLEIIGKTFDDIFALNTDDKIRPLSKANEALGGAAKELAQIYNADLIDDYWNYYYRRAANAVFKLRLLVEDIFEGTLLGNLLGADTSGYSSPALEEVIEDVRLKIVELKDSVLAATVEYNYLLDTIEDLKKAGNEEGADALRFELLLARINLEKYEKEFRKTQEDYKSLIAGRLGAYFEYLDDQLDKSKKKIDDTLSSALGEGPSDAEISIKKAEASIAALAVQSYAAEVQIDAFKKAIEALQSGDVSLSTTINDIFSQVDKQEFPKLKRLFVDELEQLFKTQNISAVEYVERRRKLEEDLLAIQINGIDKQIEATEKKLSSEKLGAELIAAFNAENDEERKRQLLDQVEAEGAIKDLAEQLLQLYKQRVDLLSTEKSAYLEIEAAVDKAANTISASAQERFNLLSQELSNLNSQVNSGLISQSQATVKAAAAIESYQQDVVKYKTALNELKNENLDYAEVIDKIIEKIDALSGRLDPNRAIGFFQNLGQQFKRTATQLGDLDTLGSNVGDTLANAIGDGLSIQLVRGREAFKSWLLTFLEGLSQAIIKALALRAVTAFLGIFNSAETAGVDPTFGPGFARGNNKGGFAGYYAGGGIIPGRGPNVDSVLAYLTRGEAITQRPAVDFYGKGFFEAINRMQFPKELAAQYSSSRVQSSMKRSFNDGGIATGSSGPMEAFIVGNDESVSTLLSQGKDGFRRVLRKYRNQFRTDLGIN